MIFIRALINEYLHTQWFWIFSKAFDVVNHHILVQRLIDNRINLLLLGRISSFLKEHTHLVVLDGIQSQLVELSSGVPQGGVLCSALFMLFINNITTSINHCAVRLFADDTLLFIYHGAW